MIDQLVSPHITTLNLHCHLFGRYKPNIDICQVARQILLFVTSAPPRPASRTNEPSSLRFVVVLFQIYLNGDG